MMTKINVLYIVDTLQIGGAEKQVVTLVKNIDRRKFRVFLCCMRNKGPLKEELENEDVMLVFLNMRLRYFIVALYKLIRIIKEQNIQIVHTHLYSSNVWGRFAAWISGVPIIIATEHGRGLWRKRRHILFERLANRFTDMRIAVSEDVRQIRIRREHTPPEKVVTVPNAINPDEFLVHEKVREKKRTELKLERKTLVVGSVARFDPDKALNIFLEACSIVLKSKKDVRVLLIGDGHLRNHLRNHAGTLGIASEVIFTGSRKDIPDLLSTIDVYVNSSIREGIPVSLLEAMAAKKPVVVTNVGGNVEVVNNASCGIIVPSNNARALADGIITLLDNESLRKRMGENARERIRESYSVSTQMKKIEAIYENLLQQKCREMKLFSD